MASSQSILFLQLILLLGISVCEGFTSIPAFQTSRTAISSGLKVKGVDKFDMEELSQRIKAQAESLLPTVEDHPYARLFNMEWTDRPKPTTVYVVLFNPDTDKEGMHTIEFPKGSGSNMLLAFESIKDCSNFAAALKEQQFFDPSPQEMDLYELEAYCDLLGVSVNVVPRGFDLKPPKAVVDELGHDPNLRETKKKLTAIFDLSDDECEADFGSFCDDSLDLMEATKSGAWE